MGFSHQNKACQEVTYFFSIQIHFKIVKERKIGFLNLSLTEQSLTQTEI